MCGYKASGSIFLLTLFVLYYLQAAGAVYSQSAGLVEIVDTDYTVQKVLNTENGLPANGLSTLMQDSRGYIWAATFNGLIRYDGKRVTVYNTENIPNLLNNRFIHVTEDPQGRIWAGLEYRSMVMIDGNKTQVYQIDESRAQTNTFVAEIFFDSEGRTIVGTNSGLYHFENDSFQRMDGLPGEGIQQIIDINGETYILFEYSLYKLNWDQNAHEQIFHIDGTDIVYKNNYRVTGFDKVERFWNVYRHGDYYLIVHENGIVKLWEDEHQVMLRNENLGQSVLHGALFFNGFYYVYGSNGLYKIEDLTLSTGIATKITDIHITNIIFDHEGSLWASSSAHGLIQFVETPVYQGNRYNFLSNVPVTAILEDRNGSFWIGTNCDGLYNLDGETITQFSIDEGITNTCVWSVMEQENGRIWAGTWGDGAFYKDPDDDIFTKFSSPGFEDVQAVLTIFEDNAGHIWFGSFDGVYSDTMAKKPLPYKMKMAEM